MLLLRVYYKGISDPVAIVESREQADQIVRALARKMMVPPPIEYTNGNVWRVKAKLEDKGFEVYADATILSGNDTKAVIAKIMKTIKDFHEREKGTRELEEMVRRVKRSSVV